MKSTARYFGRLELSGQMLRRNVLLEDLDRPAPKGGGRISWSSAPTFLGFRQLDLEQLNASRLYILEHANLVDVPAPVLPLTLKIRRADINEDSGAKAEALREDFQIEEILMPMARPGAGRRRCASGCKPRSRKPATGATPAPLRPE